MTNSVPKLLHALTGTPLREVARWTEVSIPLAHVWKVGTYQPKPTERFALLAGTRKHALLLLELADKVEREGHARAAVAIRDGLRRRNRGRKSVSSSVRALTSRRGKTKGAQRKKRGGQR